MSWETDTPPPTGPEGWPGPGETGRVADATDRNWVDRFAPEWSRPYLRLARADRPIGTWLLFIPCLWAIALGAGYTGWQWIDIWLIVASAIGAFVTRGAGCAWNDIADRHIDARVARTRSRPIPSGQITLPAAIGFMTILGLTGLLILLTFNGWAIAVGVASLVPVLVYPYAKRFTWWPQVFLGIAFNWGALLLWTAHTGFLSLPPLFLYMAGIAWTLHYDTIYAHQDREDDALIGVRSTARLFEEDTATWLWIFTGCTVFFALMAALTAGLGWGGVLGAFAIGVHMAAQIKALDIDDPEQCLALFRSNRTAGLLLAAGLALGTVF